MPVDHRTRQPFGILHGGATLALGETVAGLGSMILCQPDEIVVGMQVSGNQYLLRTKVIQYVQSDDCTQRTFLPCMECGRFYFNQ